MERYKLLIFPQSKQDLQDIVDYINELSPDAAFKLYDEIVEGIGSLAQMPMRCPLLRSSVLRAKGYRVLVVHNYLVFYVVNGKTVEIRRILYRRRQYDFLL
ncbi:addiction module toxin, RelE/StbE family [Desulfofarcimen acetoxidans DSM 771]|jgi:addiction module RelE/StbE family toxin|uniref:Addiction module toxin, RelE/StbE family n=1 Tax=Desulfofarcimen acetoxidans (strain ATCC 49208 / DSM 771 / KCTC 5769 / VKM B-1644 / 5575) TaxID=485916 RepID=C8VYS4_DESAS|nr:type II toxin-antitoxin system RelE/ParE family toxin [Desulfofarcimen acetoxidans]ACV64795.1 addiction module toxin, RelE/StbE family [Desulfofarcimen acetoxidans DSM 771]